MAIYSINNTPISNYGAIASPAQKQTLALKGVFDFPKRDGDTEYNWGNEIEPFLNTQDIKFKPKTCSLRVYIQGANKYEYEANLSAFKNAALNMISIQSSYWLDLNVIKTTGEISVQEFINKNAAVCEVIFETRNGVLNGSLGTPGGGAGFKLNNYNFQKDLNLIVQKREGDKSIPSIYTDQVTDEYEIPVTVRKEKDISISVTMISDHLANFLLQMGKLHQLLASEGLKTITFPDGSTANVYCKDGFTINEVHTGKGIVYASFYLKLREV